MSTTSEIENSEDTKATRNYSTAEERWVWQDIIRWEMEKKHFSKYYNRSNVNVLRLNKEGFRTRRSYGGSKKALRIRFENNNEIGAFIKLTNAYCLVPADEESENFSNTIAGDLSEQIPIIKTSLAGCRIIGRMCVGNKNGLLVPETIYETELQQLRNELPESVKIEKIGERLSALGNVIACNDKVALVHPDLDKETEEIISDTLKVEVFRHLISNQALVGTYCILNNNGGLVHSGTNNNDIENLASLLQIPLSVGTVNSGCKAIGAGLAVNDSMAYAGMKTTAHEFSLIESAFNLGKSWCDWNYRHIKITV